MQRCRREKMTFKIPRFISKEVNALNSEDKAKYLAQYKVWHENSITQEWIHSFEARIKSLIQEEEESTCSTEFEFQQKIASNRAMRLVLRSLIKEMNYKSA
jgi:hypothetical protein